MITTHELLHSPTASHQLVANRHSVPSVRSARTIAAQRTRATDSSKHDGDDTEPPRHTAPIDGRSPLRRRGTRHHALSSVPPPTTQGTVRHFVSFCGDFRILTDSNFFLATNSSASRTLSLSLF